MAFSIQATNGSGSVSKKRETLAEALSEAMSLTTQGYADVSMTDCDTRKTYSEARIRSLSAQGGDAASVV